jgi:predicted Zn-dependent peptidase
VAVARAFGRYRGDAPPARVIPPALPARERRITVVHRPGSEQSEIYVGTLGPPRNDPGWAAFTVMNRLLGGKGAGRLFMDVREKLSLAYETSSTIDELASGPTAFYAYSTTRTPKTGLAVQALLGHLARVAGEPATEEEIATAKRFLQLAFATRMSTLGAVAGELVALHTLGLPDDDHEGYRRALEAVTPAMVAEVAHRHLGGEHEIIAVAGDADLIAPMLSHFGAVEVVDPAGDFAPIRTIPRAPDAALEPKEHE